MQGLEETEHTGKQGRKPSVLYGGVERAQEIVDKYAGSGKIEQAGRELICLPDVAGLAWNRDKGVYENTSWICIIYSKKSGTHLYPIFSKKEKR